MTPSLHFNGLYISLKCVHSRGGQINAVIGAKKKKKMLYSYQILYISSSLFRVELYWQTLHNSTISHRLIGSKVPAKKNSLRNPGKKNTTLLLRLV